MLLAASSWLLVVSLPLIRRPGRAGRHARAAEEAVEIPVEAAVEEAVPAGAR
jgi:hypothetical protein